MGHFYESRQDLSFLVVKITENPVAVLKRLENSSDTTFILQDDGSSAFCMQPSAPVC